MSSRKTPLAQQASVESSHNTPQRADEDDVVMTQDEEDTEISFAPLSVSASSLPTILGEYFPKMDSSIKASTSGLDFLTSLEGGNWFWLKSSEGSVIGLLVYTIDTSSLRFRRINISHLSTIELSSYENALSSSIAYIWSSFPAQEIRHSLYHHENEEGKLVIKPEVKSVVDKCGFRWNNLTNTSTGVRILVMSVKRAEDIP